MILIEIADGLFSFAAVLRERPKPARDPNVSHAALGDAISRLAAIAAPSTLRSTGTCLSGSTGLTRSRLRFALKDKWQR